MTEADPAQGFKALTDFWSAHASAQGAAFLEMQRAATRSMADAFEAMFGAAQASGPVSTSGGATLSPEVVQANEALMQLWSAATGLSAELAGRLAQANDGSVATSEMLERIANPRRWLAGTPEIDPGLGEILARMVDGPRLADLFDVERRYGNVMRRWTELRRSGLEHQLVLLDAWMRTSREFMTEFASRSGADGKPLDIKRIVALWTEIGNRQMLETQRSDAFLRSQRDTIRASTELRLAQSELSEHLGKQYGLPTRTEMDDVHRTLTEMRRELRRVRRELDALKQVKPPAKPARSRTAAAGQEASQGR